MKRALLSVGLWVALAQPVYGQVASAIDSTAEPIAGLPAQVVADLARQALASDPVASEAALEALTRALNPARSSPPSLETTASNASARWSALGQWVSTNIRAPLRAVWRERPGAVALAFVGPGALLLLGALVRRQIRRGRSRLAAPWGDAVTQAAQLLARGAKPAAISRETGLARDVLSVVASRRLRPPHPTPGASSA